MRTIRATAYTTIRADIDRVWAGLADHEAMSTWGPGVRVTLSPGGEVPNGVGAVRRIKIGPGPAIVEEITDFEPGRRLSYKGISGIPFKNYGGTVTLVREGNATRAEWALSADGRVPAVEQLVLRVVARVLVSSFARSVRTS